MFKRFFLEAYRSHEQYEDVPRCLFVVLGQLEAEYYIRLLTLFDNIEKVNAAITRLEFRDDRGSYYHEIPEATASFDPSQHQAADELCCGRRVIVSGDGIYFSCEITGSPVRLDTDYISREDLDDIIKGVSSQVSETDQEGS